MDRKLLSLVLCVAGFVIMLATGVAYMLNSIGTSIPFIIGMAVMIAGYAMMVMDSREHASR
ncbi:MAG: hypothetical protein IKP20_02395 [Candidatus Methanomethylophilaceae archaeon]|jgi:biotin transporter BioY|nr:hypothetical protein [Candidatus Methanomethylophilaceae archaeon]